MARLYTDEHFPFKVTQLLRTLGHDVLTVQEAGNADQRISDEDVLAYAIAQQRAVITMNRRHFIRLHRQWLHHYGMIVCTQDPDFPALALRIHQAIEAVDSLVDQLIRVYRPS